MSAFKKVIKALHVHDYLGAFMRCRGERTVPALLKIDEEFGLPLIVRKGTAVYYNVGKLVDQLASFRRNCFKSYNLYAAAMILNFSNN